MWKKIDNYDTVLRMDTGDLITDDPDNKEDFYEVKSIHIGYVKAFHANGKLKLKIFPEAELINNWWIKEA